jgi:hypothetical protein
MPPMITLIGSPAVCASTVTIRRENFKNPHHNIAIDRIILSPLLNVIIRERKLGRVRLKHFVDKFLWNEPITFSSLIIISSSCILFSIQTLNYKMEFTFIKFQRNSIKTKLENGHAFIFSLKFPFSGGALYSEGTTHIFII